MGEADKFYKPDRGTNGLDQQQHGQSSGQQYQEPPPGYQPAAPPVPPHPDQYNNGPAQEYGDEKHSFDQTFKVERPKFHDWWAGLLLILVFAGFVAVSGIVLHGYSVTRGFNGGGIYDGSNTFGLDTNTILLFVFVLVVAFVFSWAYVWLARLFPKAFIWVTGILNLCWAVGTAVFYLWRHYWSAGIVFLIFAVFLIFCFWTWISRIPFSALMLKTSIDISKRYGHVYFVSLIGGLIATGLAAWFSITLVAIYVKYEPSADNPACSAGGGGCSQGTVIGLIVFTTFAMYWISEWLKNTIHTIIAGVYGSWYFYANNFPRHATRGATKRALTYSFGSIAFGSLLVAIIQFLRQALSVMRNQSMTNGGLGGAMGYAVFCFLGCFVSILEWAVRFINRYAFCHIALYGKAYIPAAKDTWRMMKDRGIDALVNECLIGPVLSFGAIFIAYACALLAYLYLFFTDPSYNHNGNYTAIIMAYSFLIGFQIANIFTTPLMSGIETIFVAMAWDPQVMERDHPELYREMVGVYPRVQQAIRG